MGHHDMAGLHPIDFGDDEIRRPSVRHTTTVEHHSDWKILALFPPKRRISYPSVISHSCDNYTRWTTGVCGCAGTHLALPCTEVALTIVSTMLTNLPPDGPSD